MGIPITTAEDLGLVLRTLRALELVLTLESGAGPVAGPAAVMSAPDIDIGALIDRARGPRR